MYGGGLMQNYHHSYLKLKDACAAVGVTLESSNLYNESLISRGRNTLADTYIKTTSHDFACYIDADIGFEAEDILAMMELDKPILGVPCTKKSLRWNRIQFAIAKRTLDWARQIGSTLQQGTLDELMERWKASGAQFPAEAIPRIGGDFVMNLFEGEQNRILQLDKPERMRHVGTGLLMVKREVFLKFMKCYPDRWYEPRGDVNQLPGRIYDFFKCGVNVETRHYDSEDYWFVHDCMQIGYEILLCPWVKTSHMGTFKYEGDLTAALATGGGLF
jgi:hypothetical protein